jgi:hypothetical protein
MWKFHVSTAGALCLFLLGCGLISLEQLSVKVWPSQREAILTAGASPWVEFPAPPDRASVQRLFTLGSSNGQVGGDFRWEGCRMYFDAAPPLLPGVRYVMTFRGRVTLENGEAFDANEVVTLYVSHPGAGPILLSSDPADGGVCGIARPLVLHFSAPVDANSFAREFDLQPSAETVVSWDAAALTATIAPKDGWSNLSTSSWRIGRDLAAPDGTPTGIEYAGRFRVQEDSTAPLVLSVVPALHDLLTPTGGDLDHTGADDALLITFSEDVRTDTVSSALTLTPSTRGSLMRVATGVFAFIPESRLLMAQSYTLRIAPAVEDLSGNKLAASYERTFTPDIPLQEVQSVKAVYASGGDTWTTFNTPEAKTITVDATGTLRLLITFKEPFSPDRRARMVSAIILEGYFPSSVPDPSLVSASWTGCELALSYADVQQSTADAGKYYKLTLPGGAASSDNGSGSFLKEDVWLYFLASL